MYIADLKARKGETAGRLTEGRLNKHAVPILGDELVTDLTADQIRSWLNGMVHDGEDNEDRRRSKDGANRCWPCSRRRSTSPSTTGW
jgi:hypothetical protein